MSPHYCLFNPNQTKHRVVRWHREKTPRKRATARVPHQLQGWRNPTTTLQLAVYFSYLKHFYASLDGDADIIGKNFGFILVNGKKISILSLVTNKDVSQYFVFI